MVGPIQNRTGIPLGPRARQGEFGDRPGQYQPAVRVHQPIIDPGDKLDVELFITGYGDIGPAKLAFYPSPGTFVERESRIQFNLDPQTLNWGGPHTIIDDAGTLVVFSGGIEVQGWNYRTMFFDVTPGSPPQIITETKRGKAPCTLSLVTRPDVAPGTYLLQFYLTYFNGSEWCMSVQQASFTVRTLLQRNEFAVAVVASIAAGVTIVAALLDIIAYLQKLVQ